MPSWLKLAASAIVLALGVAIFLAWHDSNRQQVALQAELKSTQEALADTTARQASRDAAVNSLVTQLKQQKAKVQSAAQVITALPQVLPLPQPILGLPPTDLPNLPSAKADAPDSTKPVSLPALDLKPLYDFAVDCKACQAQLAAAQADLKDEQAKEQALSRERDDALRAARGGSVLRRVARAAKWFAIGAAAGALAARTTR